MKDILIRPAEQTDLDAMWQIFSAHVDAGETFPFAAGTSFETCRDYWFDPSAASFVALREGGRILGMYKLTRNQAGRGAHVASASYMVAPAAQGVGIGMLLGRHSLDQARRQGYLAMQFNYVVSTNIAAVMLWKKLGFAIVGTLPKAYAHARFGYVDAYVMYQLLDDPANWPEHD